MVWGRLDLTARLLIGVLAAVCGLLPIPDWQSLAAPLSLAPSLELVGQVGGRIGGVTVRGSLAYLAMGPRLVIADVSDGDHPQLVGRSDVLPGLVDDVAVAGARAVVVAAGDAWTFDVSDSLHPVVLGHYRTQEARGVRLSDNGHVAYIVGPSLGLEVIDLSDPASPRRLAASRTERHQTSELGIEIAGSLVYLTGADQSPRGQKALRVVDVSDPAQPRTVSGSDLPGDSALAHVVVANGRVYVTDAGQGWGGGRGSLTIFYVPGAGTLLPVGRLTTKPARGVALSQDGGYVYVMTDEGLLVIDVRDEQAPSLVATVEMRGREIIVEGSHAYVVADDHLSIVDLADPSLPNLSGGLEGTKCGDCKQLVIEGQHAFTLDQDGLTVFDLDDPVAPRVVRRVTGSRRDRLAASGDLMVIGTNIYGPRQTIDGSTVQIVSLRDPGDPVVQATLDFPDQALDLGQPLALRGTLLCVLVIGPGSGPTSLRMYDLSEPSAPRAVGSLSLASASNVALRGSLAYVAGSTWAAVVDVSDPARPHVLGQTQTSDRSRPWLVLNDRIYGSVVLDVSDSRRPRQVGRLDAASWAMAVDDREQYALTLGNAELALLSLTDLSAPTTVWTERRPEANVGAIAFANGYFYVASSGGLSVYRIRLSES